MVAAQCSFYQEDRLHSSAQPTCNIRIHVPPIIRHVSFPAENYAILLLNISRNSARQDWNYLNSAEFLEEIRYTLKEHTHGFRILSATLLISEILAANISKYAAHAIRKGRDNGKYATHANSKVCIN